MSRAFDLTLVPVNRGKYDPEGTLRLRRALKALLRIYGLRCTHVREAKPVDDGKQLFHSSER